MSDQKVLSLPQGENADRVFLTHEEGTKLVSGSVELQEQQNKLRRLEGMAKIAEGNFKVAQADFVDKQIEHRAYVASLNSRYQINLYKDQFDLQTFEVFKNVVKDPEAAKPEVGSSS